MVSGSSLLTFKGHTHGITSVAFSPDGNHLVCVGQGGGRCKGTKVGLSHPLKA